MRWQDIENVDWRGLERDEREKALRAMSRALRNTGDHAASLAEARRHLRDEQAAHDVTRREFASARDELDDRVTALQTELAALKSHSQDNKEREENEAHLRLVMRELTHRSKNLLAVIQAMARQTARHSGHLDDFLDRFSARLQALSRSHDLLVQQSWHKASLGELIRLQLGHYLDRGEAQISVSGPPVSLNPEAAQGLGLALHELATNAAKYGSLSIPGGKVSILWRFVGSGIEIAWSESGGPEVTPPGHRGFGSMVIETNLTRALGAKVDLDFRKQGLACRIVIPASHLALTDS